MGNCSYSEYSYDQLQKLLGVNLSQKELKFLDEFKQNLRSYIFILQGKHILEASALLKSLEKPENIQEVQTILANSLSALQTKKHGRYYQCLTNMKQILDESVTAIPPASINIVQSHLEEIPESNQAAIVSAAIVPDVLVSAELPAETIYKQLVKQAIQHYMAECNTVSSRFLHRDGIVLVSRLQTEMTQEPNMTDESLKEKVQIVLKDARHARLKHFAPVRELPSPNLEYGLR